MPFWHPAIPLTGQESVTLKLIKTACDDNALSRVLCVQSVFLAGSHPFWLEVSLVSDLISRQTKRIQLISPQWLLISSPPPLCPLSPASVAACFISPVCCRNVPDPFSLSVSPLYKRVFSISSFQFKQAWITYWTLSLSSWTQLLLLAFYFFLASPHSPLFSSLADISPLPVSRLCHRQNGHASGD